MRQRRPVRWLLETDGVGILPLVRTTRASFPACGSFVMTSEDLRELPGLNHRMRVLHKRTFRIELNTGEYVAYVIFQLPEFEFYLLCLDASESASKLPTVALRPSFSKGFTHALHSTKEGRRSVSLVGRFFLEVPQLHSAFSEFGPLEGNSAPCCFTVPHLLLQDF